MFVTVVRSGAFSRVRRSVTAGAPRGCQHHRRWGRGWPRLWGTQARTNVSTAWRTGPAGAKAPTLPPPYRGTGVLRAGNVAARHVASGSYPEPPLLFPAAALPSPAACLLSTLELCRRQRWWEGSRVGRADARCALSGTMWERRTTRGSLGGGLTATSRRKHRKAPSAA